MENPKVRPTTQSRIRRTPSPADSTGNHQASKPKSPQRMHNTRSRLLSYTQTKHHRCAATASHLMIEFDFVGIDSYKETSTKMMNHLSKTVLTRCKTQIRCMSSISSLTRTSTCSDSTGFLTLHATAKSTKIYGARTPLADFPKFYDRSILEFSQSTQVVEQKEGLDLEEVIQAMNRNARRPKKANKGSRPCSRAGRRRRKEKIGKRSR